MHVEAFVACEPALDFGMFVRRIVVGDKVNLKFGRRLLVDQTQELQPLGVAMPLHAGANDRSIQRVEGSKERRGAVTLVVVSHRRTTTTLDRESGLRAVQRLNLALLVGAQHQRVLRRREVQSNNVFELFGEARIIAQFEGLNAMRLETMSVPDTANRFLAHADFPRHGTRAPMRRMGRMFGRRLCHNALHKLCADFRRAARPRRINSDPRNPARSKPVTPACDRARHDV